MSNVEWQRIDPTTVDKVGYRKIVGKTFEMPDGKVETFHTLHAEETHFVNVVALTKENTVILAKQFRPGPEKIMHELPGGGVEEGEDPETAMRRELEEETGYAAGNVELSIDQLLKYAFNDGLTDHATILLAYDRLRKLQGA